MLLQQMVGDMMVAIQLLQLQLTVAAVAVVPVVLVKLEPTLMVVLAA